MSHVWEVEGMPKQMSVGTGGIFTRLDIYNQGICGPEVERSKRQNLLAAGRYVLWHCTRKKPNYGSKAGRAEISADLVFSQETSKTQGCQDFLSFKRIHNSILHILCSAIWFTRTEQPKYPNVSYDNSIWLSTWWVFSWVSHDLLVSLLVSVSILVLPEFSNNQKHCFLWANVMPKLRSVCLRKNRSLGYTECKDWTKELLKSDFW